MFSAVDAPPAEGALASAKTRAASGSIGLNAGEECCSLEVRGEIRADSKEMLERDFFSYDPYGGESSGERLERFGYAPKGYGCYEAGENVAPGAAAPTAPWRAPSRVGWTVKGAGRTPSTGAYAGSAWASVWGPPLGP